MDSDNKIKQGFSEIWKGTKKGVGTLFDAGKQEIEKRNHVNKFNEKGEKFLVVDFQHNDYLYAQVHLADSLMIVLKDKDASILRPGLRLLDKENVFYEITDIEPSTVAVEGTLVHELEALQIRFQKH
jgi:hypothetical protein